MLCTSKWRLAAETNLLVNLDRISRTGTVTAYHWLPSCPEIREFFPLA